MKYSIKPIPVSDVHCPHCKTPLAIIRSIPLRSKGYAYTKQCLECLECGYYTDDADDVEYDPDYERIY